MKNRPRLKQTVYRIATVSRNRYTVNFKNLVKCKHDCKKKNNQTVFLKLYLDQFISFKIRLY